MIKYNPNTIRAIVNGQTTLSVKEKWAEVDAILDDINERKASGEELANGLEEYIDYHFNNRS